MAGFSDCRRTPFLFDHCIQIFELKSLFLGVQFKDKDQVFNILHEEGVSGDYMGILFKRLPAHSNKIRLKILDRT